jgi:Helix-turn-helix domain
MHAQGTAVPARQDAAGPAPAGEGGRIAWTVAEVAALLRKHPNTVYDWVRKGSLPSERVAAPSSSRPGRWPA